MALHSPSSLPNDWGWFIYLDAQHEYNHSNIKCHSSSSYNNGKNNNNIDLCLTDTYFITRTILYSLVTLTLFGVLVKSI